MKSVKPGRGPSLMGGIGSLVAVLFGVFWTALAPGLMKGFGLLFIVMAGVQAVYHFKNAAGKNRFSTFDVVDDQSEPDPLQQRVDRRRAEENAVDAEILEEESGDMARFCPYCGAPAASDFAFCPKCGRQLP